MYCNKPCQTGPAACRPAPQPCGYLMQQIMGVGRVWLRYERFTLPLSGLPCGACGPFELTAVTLREEGVRAEAVDCPCRGNRSFQVFLPLCCSLRDAAGCCLQAQSAITVTVPVRLCAPCGAEGLRPAVNACVRLNRPCGCGAEDTLQAWLDVNAEVWLTACRPLYTDCPPKGCPPELPLYPQPCRMR